MQKKKGFFRDIIEFLFVSSSPEAEKRRELRRIARLINRLKFKWYRPSSCEALPQMAMFFYEVYAVVGMSQAILAKANASTILKTVVVEASLSPKQRKIKEGLAEEQLRERFRADNSAQLETQVAMELEDFVREFTEEKTLRINHLYAQIDAFAKFAMFDYYFVLKKFDSGIREQDFSSEPRFETINAKYVLEDLKDFAEVAYALPLNADWRAIFEVIKDYRNVSPVNIVKWDKVIRVLHNVRKSNILTLLIRHISENPRERVSPATIGARIIDGYVSQLVSQTNSLARKISQETRVSKVSQLLQQLFGYMPPNSMRYYTQQASKGFQEKHFAGFTRAVELNYLNAFLHSYLKTDISKVSDLCIVRAKWRRKEDATAFSGSYHTLVELVEKVKEFDDSLDEYTELGSKMKSLLLRHDHDREARSQLETVIKDVNRAASSLVSAGFQSLFTIGKTLTMLLKDCQKEQPVMLSNWEYLESVAGSGMKGMLMEVCKKIYAIVMLLNIYINEESGEGKK